MSAAQGCLGASQEPGAGSTAGGGSWGPRSGRDCVWPGLGACRASPWALREGSVDRPLGQAAGTRVAQEEEWGQGEALKLRSPGGEEVGWPGWPVAE